MIYQIFIEKPAQKKLSAIPEPFQGKIIAEIGLLAENPRSFGCKSSPEEMLGEFGLENTG